MRDIALLPSVEGTQVSKNPIVERFERSSARLLSELGPSEAVRRFARKYGSPRTRTLYLNSLKSYFTWLRGQGVQLNPDALIEDNLKAVYESKATDVKTKRRHREYLDRPRIPGQTANTWTDREHLDRYVNDYLVKRGLREKTRSSIAAAVSQFYERNDSPLFGDFEVSGEETIQPPAPLISSDIRRVLKALFISDSMVATTDQGVLSRVRREILNRSVDDSRIYNCDSRVVRDGNQYYLVGQFGVARNR